MRARLEKFTLCGFKSIVKLENFQPNSLTIMIGPNGAGKSNFISFFRTLSFALSGKLQSYIQQYGPASDILHDGPEVTQEIEAELTVRTEAGENQYAFRLVYAAGDTLIFSDERCRFSRTEFGGKARWRVLSAGNRESNLVQLAIEEDKTAYIVKSLLQKIAVYQFHNTSMTARVRAKWSWEDRRWLKEDAGNLAPFLLRLKQDQPRYYARIIETTRLILPFFDDFVLEPEYEKVLLQWREKGSDRVFSVSQAADGMLRVMALVALLQQPEIDLPDILILDEPELGLHPYAITVIAGLIRSVSTKIQVIVATQSTPLIDCFEPENIVVVDRRERGSEFRRLNPLDLQEWLKEYSISELWEKNVIGGRPL